MLQTKNIRHNDHYSIKNNENVIILNRSLNFYETNWWKSMAYLSMSLIRRKVLESYIIKYGIRRKKNKT